MIQSTRVSFRTGFSQPVSQGKPLLAVASSPVAPFVDQVVLSLHSSMLFWIKIVRMTNADDENLVANRCNPNRKPEQSFRNEFNHSSRQISMKSSLFQVNHLCEVIDAISVVVMAVVVAVVVKQ